MVISAAQKDNLSDSDKAKECLEKLKQVLEDHLNETVKAGYILPKLGRFFPEEESFHSSPEKGVKFI